jgi:hypothetical protein
MGLLRRDYLRRTLESDQEGKRKAEDAQKKYESEHGEYSIYELLYNTPSYRPRLRAKSINEKLFAKPPIGFLLIISFLCIGISFITESASDSITASRNFE